MGLSSFGSVAQTLAHTNSLSSNQTLLDSDGCDCCDCDCDYEYEMCASLKTHDATESAKIRNCFESISTNATIHICERTIVHHAITDSRMRENEDNHTHVYERILLYIHVACKSQRNRIFSLSHNQQYTRKHGKHASRQAA